MKKVWTKLDAVLPSVASGTSLQLSHGDTVIFPHNQVWFELNQKYTEWGFLQDPLSNSMTVFLALYTNFSANMGNQFYRMWDALQREYNPIENYSMLEAGADGHKQSKKTESSSADSVGGSKVSDVANERTGKTVSDEYKNAFDDATATGAHVGRVETDYSPTAALTDTTKYTETKSQTVGNLSVTDQTNTTVQRTAGENTEDFDNDVSVSFKKTNPDGTDSTETLGSDFTDGTMYRHTRSGNIGVTTAQQMLTEELELRQTNLLKMWVESFIREYFSYVGDDE